MEFIFHMTGMDPWLFGRMFWLLQVKNFQQFGYWNSPLFTQFDLNG
jgi:hypothetical protein